MRKWLKYVKKYCDLTWLLLKKKDHLVIAQYGNKFIKISSEKCLFRHKKKTYKEFFFKTSTYNSLSGYCKSFIKYYLEYILKF